MSDQIIISFDSQILNTFQSCARKAKYAFRDNISPSTTADALEKGGLMHNMLEVYYSLQIKEVMNKLKQGIIPNETWRTLINEAGFEIPNFAYHQFPEIQGYAVRAGNYFASKLDISIDEVEETRYQFIEYTNYYRNDSWEPLAVEEVGSKVLFEDDQIKVIYNFKIDLVAQNAKVIAPFDHKTSKRREEPSSMSNQFIGYCYGLGVNNIVVNKIGFQKTLSPQQRFNRFILTIDDARIAEWVDNTVWWARAMILADKFDEFPMNLTSCDKYSGCVYRKICETDPESRLFKIERDFKINQDWDVAKQLEA